MSSILEVVFEGVAKSSIFHFLAILINNAEKVTDFQCSENILIFESSKLSKEGMNQFLCFEGDASVLINIKAMKLIDIVLPHVQLRLIKYGRHFDIDFNFDQYELENISMPILLESLHVFAKSLASEFGVHSVYGGMEPASDEDTRYFTNEQLGPLSA